MVGKNQKNNHDVKLHELQVLVSMNKVSSGQCHAHSATYCLWLLLHPNSRVQSLPQRPDGPKTENICYMAIYRKSLQIPALHAFSQRCVLERFSRTGVCVPCTLTHQFYFMETEPGCKLCAKPRCVAGGGLVGASTHAHFKHFLGTSCMQAPGWQREWV